MRLLRHLVGILFLCVAGAQSLAASQAGADRLGLERRLLLAPGYVRTSSLLDLPQVLVHLINIYFVELDFVDFRKSPEKALEAIAPGFRLGSVPKLINQDHFKSSHLELLPWIDSQNCQEIDCELDKFKNYLFEVFSACKSSRKEFIWTFVKSVTNLIDSNLISELEEMGVYFDNIPLQWWLSRAIDEEASSVLKSYKDVFGLDEKGLELAVNKIAKLIFTARTLGNSETKFILFWYVMLGLSKKHLSVVKEDEDRRNWCNIL